MEVPDWLDGGMTERNGNAAMDAALRHAADLVRRGNTPAIELTPEQEAALDREIQRLIAELGWTDEEVEAMVEEMGW